MILKKAFAILLGLSLLLSGCTQEAEGLKKVKVSEVTRSVFYAPSYVALSEGFFEEEGLDIELTTGQGADKVMTSVLSGEADIGFSGPEAVIYVYKEGRENYPKIFAQVTKRDGSFILGREKDENFSLDKLKGKKILGGRKGGMPEMTLEYVLKNNGLTPGKDVEVDTSIQFALMAGAFSGGEGDYVTLFEPAASLMEREGKGYVLASVGEKSGEIPYTCYYAGEDYMMENPEVIERFVRALGKGQKWLEEHTPEEVAESIAPFFPDADTELLSEVTKRHKETDVFTSSPFVREEGFKRLLEVMKNSGVIENDVSFGEIVDNSFAVKVKEGK